MAKAGALKVGEDLAMTPGSVIDKDDRAEVLQYPRPPRRCGPARSSSCRHPSVATTSWTSARAAASWSTRVSRGLQTFLFSWRNPSADQADWDIDTYAERILAAIDAVREATGSEDVNVIGFCAGGIFNTAVLNYLAAGEISACTRRRTPSHCSTSGSPRRSAAFSSARLLSLARWNSARRGRDQCPRDG